MQLQPGVATRTLAAMCLLLPDTARLVQQQLDEEGIAHPVLDRLSEQIALACARCREHLQAA